MHGRYIKGGNFWDATSNILDSGTWKHLSNTKSKALECIRKSIGNGETTSIWFDPWIQEGRIVDLLHSLSPQQTGTGNWTVSRLIHNSQWNIIIPCLIPLLPSIANISITGQKDSCKWLPTGNGVFSFYSAWNHIRSSGAVFELYNVVWFPSSNPRMSYCLLKALYNRLSTRDRLINFGISSSDICVLCNLAKESRDHLYFQCPYSIFIWKLCKLKLQMNDIDDRDLNTEAQNIQRNFKLKDKSYILARLALNSTVWHVWQERIRRIFQNQKMHKIMVFRRIYEDIKISVEFNCLACMAGKD
ncbi:uncharacterized protein LOC109823135 [Asparagus officinalis]|uniref:uncharacterized protein LOC109823135 n=1 Tax=Asparagus officinalis TaxID=4686 RepID=UPI00098E6589|nr:uncharacterized protein LOC109823135 [Asparagus officinalis]